MKRIIFAAFCSITALFAASCGRTISDSQTFKPNMGPTISDVTFTLPDGITAATLGNSMVVRITVTASDPEGKELRYSFSSEAGAVGNIVSTSTGCTAELYTTNVRSGAEVRLTVTAKDVKGAVETRKDLLVGSGRKGANIIIDTAPAVVNVRFVPPAIDPGPAPTANETANPLVAVAASPTSFVVSWSAIAGKLIV